MAAFIRVINGIDRKKALAIYQNFIEDHNLTSEQERYLKNILDYVSVNGDIQTKNFTEYPLKALNWRVTFGEHFVRLKDFSIYRVSNVKFRIQSYMGTIFQEIADSAKDDALLSEMKDIYGRYAFAEDNQLLQIADAFDEFWNKYKNDMRVRPVIDSYIKESLCMPME